MGKKDAARPRIVCCAIPISRISKKILVITSRKRTSNWLVPKGGYESTDASLAAAAEREAYEEAGVRGTITSTVTTIYSTAATYHFFELDVTRLEDTWPESKERNREWVDFGEAVRRLTWKDELRRGVSLCSLAPKIMKR